MSPQTPDLKTQLYCEIQRHCANLFGEGLNVTDVHLCVKVPHDSFKIVTKIRTEQDLTVEKSTRQCSLVAKLCNAGRFIDLALVWTSDRLPDHVGQQMGKRCSGQSRQQGEKLS